MICPVCKTAGLQATELAAAPAASLSARHCGTCGGNWVDGEIYLLWVERQGTHQPEKQPDHAPGTAVQETTKAKLCPSCGRLLARAKVGHGVDFHIDRCGGCGGIWFDAHEWEALVARNLHDDVHHIFSTAWQADVHRKEREAHHEQLMIAKLGEADWQEIRRIKAWLDSHPRRAELFAILQKPD